MGTDKKRRGRPGKYPDYLLKQYGHSSRKFEARHRMRLKIALKWLREASKGSLHAPSVIEISHAIQAIKVAIDVTSPSNWKQPNSLFSPVSLP